MSLSGLDYSAIGFSKTKTEEFEDLKTGQGDLTQHLDAVVLWHNALAQKKEEADLKAAKEATAAASAVAAEAPAKEEAEPTDVEIGRSVSEAQFCETRADLIDDIQIWASEDRSVSVETLRRPDQEDDRLRQYF